MEQLARHAEDAYKHAVLARPLQWLLSEQESRRSVASTRPRVRRSPSARARSSSDFKALERMTSFGAIFKGKPWLAVDYHCIVESPRVTMSEAVSKIGGAVDVGGAVRAIRAALRRKVGLERVASSQALPRFGITRLCLLTALQTASPLTRTERCWSGSSASARARECAAALTHPPRTMFCRRWPP